MARPKPAGAASYWAANSITLGLRLGDIVPEFNSMPRQVPNMQELHQRLRDVIAGHCASWPGVTTLQKARGLAATPYPLCNMLLGIHLRASLAAAFQAVLHAIMPLMSDSDLNLPGHGSCTSRPRPHLCCIAFCWQLRDLPGPQLSLPQN